MTSRLILIFAFALFSPRIDGFHQEPEKFGPNYRRKAVNSQIMKTTLQTANSHLYNTKVDWTKKAECHVDDSSVECHLVENGTMCFGAPVPFVHSSWKHMETLKWGTNPGELAEQFVVFAGLPECWRLLRELLCATFYPQCKNGRVLRIQRSLCVDARSKCSFLVERNLWPNAFGDCYYSNETTLEGLNSIFSSDCKIPRNIIWQSNSECLHPLTLTDFKQGWMVDRCGLNCTSLRIDRSQPIQQLLMFYLFIIFIGSLVTAIILLCEDKDFKTRRPYFWPLFYFLVCHMALSICWLVQITFEVRTICREDGSIRLQEPTSAGILCVLQYIILLACSVGSSAWIVLFAFMHMQWRRKPDTCVFSQYYHVAMVALVIIVITGGLTTLQVDGDPVLSVCFVSKATWYGVVWYTAPLLISSVAVVLLFAGIYFPSTDSNCSVDIRPRQPPSAVQVGIVLLLLVVIHLASAMLMLFEVRHSDTLHRVITKYVECKLGSGHHEDEDDPLSACQYQSNRDVSVAQFQVVLMCSPAFVVDIWLLFCVGFRKRLFNFLKKAITVCKKAPAPVTNGGVVVEEMTTLNDSDRIRNFNYRRSCDYSSTSSIGGAVSEPEFRTKNHKESQRQQFITRMKKNRIKHRSASSSLASLRNSVPLATGHSSQISLPFPNLKNFPVLPPSNANGWPFFPFGWPCPPPWPWGPYGFPPSATGASPTQANSTGAVPTISPQQQQVQTTSFDNASSAGAQDSAQAAPNSNGPSPETLRSMIAAGNAPFFWPYPFPPFPNYWPPPMAQMFSAPENQVLVQLATSSQPTSPTLNEQEALEVGETAANEAIGKEADVEEARMKEEENNQVAQDGEEEKCESDEDSLDSEEVKSDEEELIEEQMRLLLGKGGDCT